MQNLFFFVLGLMLSFLGQLPVGTISLSATQIAVQENFRNAWKYSVGVALIEMIYLRIILSAIQWMIKHKLLLDIYNWVTVAFFLALGIVWSRCNPLDHGEVCGKAGIFGNVNHNLIGPSCKRLPHAHHGTQHPDDAQ